MVSTDVCANCGKFFNRTDEHECSSTFIDIIKYFHNNDPRLLKENPLISQGNPVSPPIEPSSVEENFENSLSFSGFLDTDTTLYSDELPCRVSEYGNPLDGPPNELLVTNGSNESLDEKAKSTVSEAASAPLSSGSQIGSYRPDSRDHSRNETKYSPLKHSPKEAFPCCQCGKTCCFKDSYADHMILNEDQSTSEASVDLLRSNQAGPSNLGTSEHSTVEPKKSPTKQSPKNSFLCEKCGNVISCSLNLENHLFLHLEIKSHECQTRRETFAEISNLRRHNCVNTQERRFNCPTCGRSFTFQSNCSRHQRRYTK